MPCIQYLIQFYECQDKIKAPINFGNKVNTMILAYIIKLGLPTQKTSVKTWKIDYLILETYSMAINKFQSIIV